MGHAPIISQTLLHYLEVRCIPLQLALRFCREIKHSLYKMDYYAVGFKNDADGYELRNPYFKGSSSPKGFTGETGTLRMARFFWSIGSLSKCDCAVSVYLVLFGLTCRY
ncbi:hypothetical protein [Chitinophaga polysaccharea]|uniref:hypothetical protein n=1 Tax=Chitinophaga polysaccharea TaxID=1293035 RepID=UPI00119C9EA7|nr:hypothetical protein [Chitinophaga polysaccharea]